MTFRTLARLLAGLALLVLPAARLAAQQPRTPVPPARYEGVPIRLVYVDLRDSAGTELADSALRMRMVAATRVRAGMPFTQLGADLALRELKAQPEVRSASWELYETTQPGAVVLVFHAVVAPEAPKQEGLLYTGRLRDFPTLLETRHALLRVQLNGGLGAFSDRRAWFGGAPAFVGGSPLFPDPADTAANWVEYSIEAGVHGALQISRHSYLFGSVTGVGAGSAGQDLWRQDTRWEVELEKAYGGWLIEFPEQHLGVSLSYGKQTWQLNQAFLFSQYAGNFNAAEWGASYLAARTALQQSALAKVRWRKFTIEGFLIDPQEYRAKDSGTEYTGVDARFNDPKTFDVAVAYYAVPRSASTYLLPDGSTAPREGLRTINARVVTSRAGGVPGLQAEGEYAHQWNANFPMAANAWYAQLGYVAEKRAWQPNLSYRFGFFQGDDPATATYERFDAPQSSGSDNWLQGNILRKAVPQNANVLSHRVRLGLSPRRGMNVVVSYFHLWADERNNRGGARPLQQLEGDTYGDEVDVTLGWSLNRRLYLLGLAGIAVPGDAIDRALAGGARNWRSLQLSLFWNL